MQGFSRSKDEAVSPVIGTILIIALTVIIVGIFAVGIFASALLGYNIAEPAPILGISIAQEGNITTLTHLNGEVLTAGSYKILVDGEDKTADFGGTVNLSPGMTLTWDSGTEAVGTVSVVYMGMNGGETVLMQKTIGKAGSGGGGFEDRYTIITRVNWQTFLDEVNASSTAPGLRFVKGTVYVDNGEYWVSISNERLSKADAAKNPSIQEYMADNPRKKLVKINLSQKIYTESDMNPANFEDPWKSAPYPEIGSLYEYAGSLYMDIIPSSGPYNPTRDPNTTTWVKIANIK